MKKCVSCKLYTIKTKCPKCGQNTNSPEPPKFSPQDKYGAYRRKMVSTE